MIAYLRSGDFATLSLICGGALFAGLLVLNFKPYIFRRFASWGHALGVRLHHRLSADPGHVGRRLRRPGGGGGRRRAGCTPCRRRTPTSYSHAVRGVGPAHRPAGGGLYRHPGPLCRPGLPGLGRSAFYTIAACAAGSLMVVQTALNIFGAMDLLPLTGVTLPFVSNGGSAMLASWGLLAFLKASDTREKSSFAIRSPAGKEVPVP